MTADLRSFILKTFPYKICHLAKYYPPMSGGIESHVHTLARSQANLGAKVSVICVNGLNEKGCKSLVTSTVKELDGDVGIVRLGRLFSFARFDLCPGFFKEFWKLVKESYDIVHLHTPNPTMLIAWSIAWLIAWVTRRPQAPLVITHHSDVIKQRILKYALRPIEYLVYRQASCILTTSHEYIEGSKFLRIYKNKLKTLPLGLDCIDYIKPSQKAIFYSQNLEIRYGQPIWLAVGRLVYYKALHIAVEALAFVPGTLIIVGTGPLETELKVLAKKLKLDERIVWHGHASTDELIGAYHAATALWFPSNVRSEGFGLVQVEAMASGCPVINADIPCSGVPWVSRHEKESLTVPINDPVALAQAAKRLLNEPQLCTHLSIAGRQRAYKEFDHVTMAERSFEIYAQVLRCSNFQKQSEIFQVE